MFCLVFYFFPLPFLRFLYYCLRLRCELEKSKLKVLNNYLFPFPERNFT